MEPHVSSGGKQSLGLCLYTGRALSVLDSRSQLWADTPSPPLPSTPQGHSPLSSAGLAPSPGPLKTDLLGEFPHQPLGHSESSKPEEDVDWRGRGRWWAPAPICAQPASEAGPLPACVGRACRAPVCGPLSVVSPLPQAQLPPNLATTCICWGGKWWGGKGKANSALAPGPGE